MARRASPTLKRAASRALSEPLPEAGRGAFVGCHFDRHRAKLRFQSRRDAGPIFHRGEREIQDADAERHRSGLRQLAKVLRLHPDEYRRVRRPPGKRCERPGRMLVAVRARGQAPVGPDPAFPRRQAAKEHVDLAAQFVVQAGHRGVDVRQGQPSLARERPTGGKTHAGPRQPPVRGRQQQPIRLQRQRGGAVVRRPIQPGSRPVRRQTQCPDELMESGLARSGFQEVLGRVRQPEDRLLLCPDRRRFPGRRVESAKTVFRHRHAMPKDGLIVGEELRQRLPICLGGREGQRGQHTTFARCAGPSVRGGDVLARAKVIERPCARIARAGEEVVERARLEVVKVGIKRRRRVEECLQAEVVEVRAVRRVVGGNDVLEAQVGLVEVRIKLVAVVAESRVVWEVEVEVIALQLGLATEEGRMPARQEVGRRLGYLTVSRRRRVDIVPEEVIIRLHAGSLGRIGHVGETIGGGLRERLHEERVNVEPGDRDGDALRAEGGDRGIEHGIQLIAVAGGGGVQGRHRGRVAAVVLRGVAERRDVGHDEVPGSRLRQPGDEGADAAGRRGDVGGAVVVEQVVGPAPDAVEGVAIRHAVDVAEVVGYLLAHVDDGDGDVAVDRDRRHDDIRGAVLGCRVAVGVVGAAVEAVRGAGEAQEPARELLVPDALEVGAARIGAALVIGEPAVAVVEVRARILHVELGVGQVGDVAVVGEAVPKADELAVGRRLHGGQRRGQSGQRQRRGQGAAEEVG